MLSTICSKSKRLKCNVVAFQLFRSQADEAIEEIEVSIDDQWRLRLLTVHLKTKMTNIDEDADFTL